MSEVRVAVFKDGVAVVAEEVVLINGLFTVGNTVALQGLAVVALFFSTAATAAAAAVAVAAVEVTLLAGNNIERSGFTGPIGKVVAGEIVVDEAGEETVGEDNDMILLINLALVNGLAVGLAEVGVGVGVLGVESFNFLLLGLFMIVVVGVFGLLLLLTTGEIIFILFVAGKLVLKPFEFKILLFKSRVVLSGFTDSNIFNNFSRSSCELFKRNPGLSS